MPRAITKDDLIDNASMREDSARTEYLTKVHAELIKLFYLENADWPMSREEMVEQSKGISLTYVPGNDVPCIVWLAFREFTAMAYLVPPDAPPLCTLICKQYGVLAELTVLRDPAFMAEYVAGVIGKMAIRQHLEEELLDTSVDTLLEHLIRVFGP